MVMQPPSHFSPVLPQKTGSRILLVTATTGYQAQAFLEAAARIGVPLVPVTDRCHVLDDPWGDQAIPVRFEEPEASAESAWERLQQGPPVQGIVALADRPTAVAAHLALRLGLPYHLPAAVAASRNKFLAHERFRAAGLPVARYARHRWDTPTELLAAASEYPCVLKPLGLSASRGVIRADDPAGFEAAFRRIAALLRSPEIRRFREEQDEYIQVEEYLPGREYALEGLVTAGRFRAVAIFDKPDPLEGPYFEETLYITPSRLIAAEQEHLIAATQQAVTALGLSQGPVHAELRVGPTGVYVLEVAARPIGGLCARTLRFASGQTWEEVILYHALGVESGPLLLQGPAAGVMMIPIPQAGAYRGVEGVAEAEAVPGIEAAVITAKEGQKLVPLPEGASYLGFLFARAATAEQVENALRAAHTKLRFLVSTGLPVLPGR